MGAYEENIKRLMLMYRAEITLHLAEMERMMGIETIPVYTRWQELKAVMRAFDGLKVSTEKALRFLDAIHNAKKADEN